MGGKRAYFIYELVLLASPLHIFRKSGYLPRRQYGSAPNAAALYIFMSAITFWPCRNTGTGTLDFVHRCPKTKKTRPFTNRKWLAFATVAISLAARKAMCLYVPPQILVPDFLFLSVHSRAI